MYYTDAFDHMSKYSRRIVWSAVNLFNSYLYNRTSFPIDTHLPFGNLSTLPTGGSDGSRSANPGSKQLAHHLQQARLEAVLLLKRHQVQWFHLLTHLEVFPLQSLVSPVRGHIGLSRHP